MSNDEFLSIGAKAQPISSPNPSPMSTADLQFQRAVPATSSSLNCQVCGTAISEDYFRARGQVVCRSCAEKVRTAASSPSLKSMPGAILFGIGAAIGGSALYSIVTIVTGYQLALISIVVGYMVGKAIRHGSKGFGGRPQQILAVVLTYLAITTSYVTMGIYHMVQNPKSATSSSADTVTTSKSATVTTEPEAGGAGIIVLLLTLGALTVAAPFLTLSSGFSGIISIIILFIGLKQAWKLTERPEIQVTGPYKPSSET